MRSKLEIWIAIALSLIFIGVNGYLIKRYGFNYGNAIPFVLLAGFWLLFAPYKLFLALVFLTPLSVPLRRLVHGLDFDFWFPTEPILVCLLLLLILKSFKERFFRKELLQHPIFLSILFFLGWLIIASVTSELPIVSFKYFLVRLWFVGIFFYLAYIVFTQNINNINRFLWAYTVGISIVIVFSIFKQAGSGLLNHYSAHGASSPFFIDHTSYGAALAFMAPIITAFALNAKTQPSRILLWGLTLFFLIALVLSYSRAAWLSLVAGAGVWVLILLRIKFRTLVVTGLILLAAFFTFQDEIIWRLERNTTDSSGDLAEHVQSIFNVSTDASNLERLNRWDAAYAMFKERPVFGWGPGTYQFVYAPFQMSYNKTIISTNFGTGGNAHSEYLGLMSEAGILSVFGYILILFFFLIRGFSLINLPNITNEHRNIAIACIVGVITYILHGFLNNFLDADKIAVLFWGFMAIIVALEYHYRHSNFTGGLVP